MVKVVFIVKVCSHVKDFSPSFAPFNGPFFFAAHCPLNGLIGLKPFLSVTNPITLLAVFCSCDKLTRIDFPVRCYTVSVYEALKSLGKFVRAMIGWRCLFCYHTIQDGGYTATTSLLRKHSSKVP